MRLLNIVSTMVAYVCAGAAFASNMPLFGLFWIVCGVANHFISIAW